jgi:uncharacterized membrane protein HdeD (DUF308 family)
MSASGALESRESGGQSGLFPWWLVLIEGVAAIIIGIMLFAAPQATLELVIELFGLFWLVDGVLRIASACTNPIDRGLKLLVGGIGVLAGLAVVRHPLLLATMMTWMLVLLLGGAGVVIGVISLYMAFRGSGWGAGILGVLSLLFGLLVLFNPVMTGFAWIYLYASVSLIGGIMAVGLAINIRRPTEPADSAVDPIEPDRPARSDLT